MNNKLKECLELLGELNKQYDNSWVDYDGLPLNEKGREFHSKLRDLNLSELSKDDLLKLGFGYYDDNKLLIPLYIYEGLKDGVVLESILGNIKVKGKDYVDLDIRGGYIAYALKDAKSDYYEFNLSELLDYVWKNKIYDITFEDNNGCKVYVNDNGRIEFDSEDYFYDSNIFKIEK